MNGNRLAALFGLVSTVAVAQTSAALFDLTAVVPANACLDKRSDVQFPPQAPDQKNLVDFLNARLAVWQHRLNLQNWKVTIELTPRTELRSGTIGQVKWDKSGRTAVISVLEPSALRGNPNAVLQEIESTLVHELVHLSLALLPRSESSRQKEEHAVDNIARALMAAHARN